MNPRKTYTLLLAGLLVLGLTSSALAQFPGGGKGGGGWQGGGGKGGMTADPEERFKSLAKGKDYIVIAEIQDFSKFFLEKYAKDNNITDGKISKDQYLKYSEDKKKTTFTFGGGGFGGAPGGGKPSFGSPGGTPNDPKVIKSGDVKPDDKGGGPGKPGGPGGPGGVPPNKTETPEEFEKRVEKETEAYFKSRDHNQDGFLNQDEMSKTLRDHYKQFDKNNDGMINLEECKDYIRAYLKGEIGFGPNSGKGSPPGPGGSSGKGGAAAPSGTDITIDLSELDTRPEVYTGGKLPGGLPAWFTELDTDKDGQIGLYEWIEAGRKIEEFKVLDRNADGFLTPDEVLLSQLVAKTAPAKTAPGSDPDDESPGATIGENVFILPGGTPGSTTPGTTPMGKFGNGQGSGKKWGGFGGFSKDNKK